jgi:hypothetical protein
LNIVFHFQSKAQSHQSKIIYHQPIVITKTAKTQNIIIKFSMIACSAVLSDISQVDHTIFADHGFSHHGDKSQTSMVKSGFETFHVLTA